MSKLNVDQKNIKLIFQDKKADFLIPDYQRPYAWSESECQTLWDDIFAFAFPDNDYTKFDSNEEYYLGPIVTFENDNKKKEVIDGQQRLTTLLLLLRAFYDKFENMQDSNSIETKKNIEKCIWRTNEFEQPDKSALKIDSEVATDKDKEDFLAILKSGIVQKSQTSNYAENYRFFLAKIDDFLKSFPSYFPYLPTRILNNCILLPIEAESQDTALRIFSTLNDRGKPLSDADIFKAQFYKYYSKTNRKADFIQRWKKLEELSEMTFQPPTGTPMDELFMRYMYFARAEQGIKISTMEALRKFYEKNKYEILQRDETFDNLIILAEFWSDVIQQNKSRFSERVLRRLFVLNYAPNGMWTYLVSVYFLKNKTTENLLDDDGFYSFLRKITGFIWAYSITKPGVNMLRTPAYTEMLNIVQGRPVTFENFKFDRNLLKRQLNDFRFVNMRPITKSMVMWYAFQDEQQTLPLLKNVFEIEHIYSVGRQNQECTLTDNNNLESIGNKAPLEKRINIRASDYRFEDKKKYYYGFKTQKGEKKEGTEIVELRKLADNLSDFTEQNIIDRCSKIIDAFITFLEDNQLTL